VDRSFQCLIIFLGRKDFLPVEPPPQADLSFLFLLGRTQVRLIPLLYQVSGHRQMYFRPRGGLHAQEYRLRLKQLPFRHGGLLAISILNPSRSSRLLPFQAFFRGSLC
jgi:hypothetical protein